MEHIVGFIGSGSFWVNWMPSMRSRERSFIPFFKYTTKSVKKNPITSFYRTYANFLHSTVGVHFASRGVTIRGAADAHGTSAT